MYHGGAWLALIGTACLVLVVLTSIRAARGRLRHERWHLLHLYAHLFVALALPHQLWTGEEFVSSPAATAAWWTLWAGAALAVLLRRVGLPLVRSLRAACAEWRPAPSGPRWASFCVVAAGHSDDVRVSWTLTEEGSDTSTSGGFAIPAAPVKQARDLLSAALHHLRGDD